MANHDRIPIDETWHDPIVAEVRQAREALFAEANYDVYEFCRRLAARQTTSGHSVVKRDSTPVEDSAEEPFHSASRAKAG
jgi:hypothetical protein